MRCLLAVLTSLCAVLLLGIGGAHADSHFGIYFADFRTGKVQRADPDGSNVVDLVTGVKPGGITVDVAGGKVYWTDFVYKDINRANLDGTDDEVLFFLDTPHSPLDVALDVSAGQMYWTDYGTAQPGTDTQFISRGNMDGSGTVTQLVTSGDVDGGLHVPAGIALDVDGGKMYWTDYGTKKIQRADLDGSNVEDLVTGLSRPNGIALDIANGRFYWAEQNTAGPDTPGKIQYANLDGTGVTDLITGLDNPFRLALDLNAGQVYWTTGNVPNVGGEAGVILQANLDGTGGIETAVSGLTYPWGIALITEMTPPSGDPADLNMDGFVDGLDLGILLGNWNTNTTPDMGELDGTPPVDGLDLGILLGAWNPPPLGTAAAVPEPTSIALLVLATLSLLAAGRQQRRRDPERKLASGTFCPPLPTLAVDLMW